MFFFYIKVYDQFHSMPPARGYLYRSCAGRDLYRLLFVDFPSGEGSVDSP